MEYGKGFFTIINYLSSISILAPPQPWPAPGDTHYMPLCMRLADVGSM